jgi:hypothetical protein
MGQAFSDLLPGYQNGVFLSYAHVDDQAPAGFEQGWVTQLAGELEKHLQQLLVCESPNLLWRDRNQARGGEHLSELLGGAISSSAVFLAILSPAYVGKDYCVGELTHFVRHCGPGLGARLIFAEMLPESELQHLPAEARSSVRVRFFDPPSAVQQLRRYGYPTLQSCAQSKDGVYANYYSALNALVESIKKRFLELGYRKPKGDANRVAIRAPKLSRTQSVLVAESSDDLDRARRELCEFLRDAGYEVRPAGSYFFGSARFREPFDEDLAASDLYVQLLGAAEGRAIPQIERPYVLFQHERAAARGRPPRLLWRDPALDPRQVSNEALRDLLKSENVFSGTLESFKQEVEKRLARLREPAPEPVAAATPGPGAELKHRKVFLNANQDDQQVLNSLAGRLVGKVVVQRPLFSGPARTKRKVRRELISDCDAMILVQDRAPASWAYEQLAESQKVRTRAFSLLGLCAEEPQQRIDDLPMVPPELRPIRPDQLESVVGAL